MATFLNENSTFGGCISAMTPGGESSGNDALCRGNSCLNICAMLSSSQRQGGLGMWNGAADFDYTHDDLLMARKRDCWLLVSPRWHCLSCERAGWWARWRWWQPHQLIWH